MWEGSLGLRLDCWKPDSNMIHKASDRHEYKTIHTQSTAIEKHQELEGKLELGRGSKGTTDTIQ